jgi:hypothetical protein
VISSGGEGLPPWAWIKRRARIKRWHVAVLVLAAAVAGITAFVMRSHPAPPVTTVATSGAVGVFAEGTDGSHRWQLAVRDIAGPSYRCVPGVTLNGSDADPVVVTGFSGPAFIEVGHGTGFSFLQLPADADQVWLDPVDGLRISTTPVTVTACGQRFRMAGFAYPLQAALRVHVGYGGRAATALTVPLAISDPRPSFAEPEVAGLWQATGAASPALANAVVAAGSAADQPWSVKVMFGPAGDCFILAAASSTDDGVSARPDWNLTCGPVSAPGGPDLVVVLPLAVPADDGPGTGYALSVSPGTTGLIARLSGGRTIQARPVVVDGREYAAFFVPAPSRLTGLTFITSGGRRSTSDLPAYGYVQVQA